jgi:hypothetical protein
MTFLLWQLLLVRQYHLPGLAGDELLDCCTVILERKVVSAVITLRLRCAYASTLSGSWQFSCNYLFALFQRNSFDAPQSAGMLLFSTSFAQSFDQFYNRRHGSLGLFNHDAVTAVVGKELLAVGGQLEVARLRSGPRRVLIFATRQHD